MTQAIAFLIKDADEPKMLGILIQTEREMDFDDVKREVERIVNYEELQDKFYCNMASDETTLTFIDVLGVPMPVFVYRDVKMRDWVQSAADVLAKYACGYTVTLFTPEALAIAVKNTMGIMGIADLSGPLRGLPYKEF